jgi:3-isopropylmalate/(R)-2-methylmalate dehydratase large subunit
MEGRMTVCNMSIEGGARAGLIAPDEKTFAYLKGRRGAEGRGLGRMALAYWKTLLHRRGRAFRQGRRARRGQHLPPIVTWGTSPRTCCRSPASCPTPTTSPTKNKRVQEARARLHGPDAGTKITDIKIDAVFIGSCTNGRIEDLRAVAGVVEGQEGRADRQAPWSCRARAW